MVVRTGAHFKKLRAFRQVVSGGVAREEAKLYKQNNMSYSETKTYESPLIAVTRISAENGFAGSGFGAANQAGETVTENSSYSYDL